MATEDRDNQASAMRGLWRPTFSAQEQADFLSIRPALTDEERRQLLSIAPPLVDQLAERLDALARMQTRHLHVSKLASIQSRIAAEGLPSSPPAGPGGAVQQSVAVASVTEVAPAIAPEQLRAAIEQAISTWGPKEVIRLAREKDKRRSRKPSIEQLERVHATYTDMKESGKSNLQILGKLKTLRLDMSEATLYRWLDDYAERTAKHENS